MEDRRRQGWRRREVWQGDLGWVRTEAWGGWSCAQKAQGECVLLFTGGCRSSQRRELCTPGSVQQVAAKGLAEGHENQA